MPVTVHPAPANGTSVTAAELAVAQTTAGFTTTSTTPVNVPGMVITVPDSPHPTMIEFSAKGLLATESGAVAAIEIHDATAGVVIGGCSGASGVPGYGVPAYARARVPASAGERTYQVRLFRLVGTGSVGMSANAQGPAILSARVA